MPPEQTNPSVPQAGNPYAVPIAIVLAGALIAFAVYAINKDTAGEIVTVTEPTGELSIPPVTSEDHIIGNPDADIIIVEYSDLECPFCKEFHKTMKTIMDEFGKDGKVAWVYRNFPLASLHPNAPKVAEAAECVAELNGNDAYWAFLDALFVSAPAGKALDMNDVPGIAESVGVQSAAFTECYNSGRMKTVVDKGFNEAVTAGQQLPNGNIGTPFNVILAKGNPPSPVIGAQPLPAMRQIIQTILAGPSAQVIPQ